MRIVAVGTSVQGLARTCFLTLRKLRTDGNEVSLIIVKDRTDRRDSRERDAKAAFEKSGISSVYPIEEFDYTGVSQRNANILSTYIKVIKPSLVLMPFWKSDDEKDRILSKTALIACRGIGSVFMFDEDKKSTFTPTASFMLNHDEIISTVNAVDHPLAISGANGIQTVGSRPITDSAPAHNSVRGVINVEIESFEIHRTVLLEEPWE